MNYKALNNDTGVIDSTDTYATAVMQYAVDAVSSAGGGGIFVGGGTQYDMEPSTNHVELDNNFIIMGEDKYSTILQQPSTAESSIIIAQRLDGVTFYLTLNSLSD